MDLWIWIVFNAAVIAMLLIDLLVFHRQAHEVKFREAMGWSVFWVALGVGFMGFVWWYYDAHYDPIKAASAAFERLGTLTGKDAALKYITGYLIEKALSVDNLFVFLMVFGYFAVPPAYQHRVLFWGIVGALIFRAIFIFAGVELITRFHWMIYLFGGFLILTGVKMAFTRDKELHPENNPVIKLLRRIMPVSGEYHGQNFVIRRHGKLTATPLLVALILVETTDVIFAVDSIPAILAITADPFIVYTSNVFAILGLRALFFALAGLMKAFAYLHFGLALILVFVGCKMIVIDWLGKIPTAISLGVVGAIIGASIGASMLFPPRAKIAA